MPIPAILALVTVGLTLLEQGATTIAKLQQIFERGAAEGWDDARWREEAMRLREESDRLDEATEARLDALIQQGQASSGAQPV